MASLIISSLVSYVTGSTLAGTVASYLVSTLMAPDGPDTHGYRLSNLTTQSNTEGFPIKKVYGTSRVAGNLIWSGGIQETSHTQSTGGKGGGGGGSHTTYTYSASFAVGLCEGPIVGIKRIWADSVLIYDKGDSATNDELAVSDQLGITIYTGSEDQEADPLMEADKGSGNVPAYRGLAYVVFDTLQLEKYGNRIPNITCEVVEDGSISPPGFNTKTTATTYYSSIKRIIEVPGNKLCAVVTTTFHPTLGTGDYLYTSTDGDTWTRASDNLRDISGYSVRGIYSSNSSLYICFEDRYIYKATDEYFNWTQITFSIPPAVFNTFIVDEATQYIYTTLSSTYAQGAHIYKYNLGLGGGVWQEVTDQALKGHTYTIFKFTDDNIYWLDGAFNLRRLNMPSETVELLYTQPTGYFTLLIPDYRTNALFYCRGAELHISYDYGVTWKVITQAQSGFLGYIRGVVVDSNNTIWVHDEGTRIHYSTDNGDSWILVGSYGTVPQNYVGIAFNNYVYFGSNNYGYIFKSFPNKVISDSRLLSDVVNDLCNKAEMTSTDVSSLSQTLHGYVRSQPMTVREALEPLLQAYQVSAVESDYQLKFEPMHGISDETVSEADLGASENQSTLIDKLKVSRKQGTELPRRLEVVYSDKDGDYQQGNQFAQRIYK